MRIRHLSVAVIAALAVTALVTSAASGGGGQGRGDLQRIKHIVVIYEENHSFDNLYGGWEGVNGRASADAAHTTQVGQGGLAYTCLMQNDVNLAAVLPAGCTDSTTGTTFTSHFTNAPFSIGAFIPKEARTCPQPGVFAANGLLPSPNNLEGGCTRDLVHRFYQEPYQLNNGMQNRYTTGSDAVGLTQGYYDTTALPIYDYLHSAGHPDYAIADDFFQSAFGGSFLNHQWLIAARTPTWLNALNDGSANDLHSVLDTNGMPTSYPLYTTPAAYTLGDRSLTQSCNPFPGSATVPARGPVQPAFVCGDYAVNTTQPPYQPYAPGTSPARLLPPQTTPTIGDRLSSAGIDWAWYSGGWSNANGDIGAPGWTETSAAPCSAKAATGSTWPNCPDKVFQFHHQPFNYYAAYAPGTAGRTHLRDEVEFQDLVAASDQQCMLDSVSFVKPVGLENEHPGYTSETRGSDHLVDLLQSIESSKCAKDTMIIVTYDEFGGQWDHVSPPGQGGTSGPHDQWGPGTRLPTLIVASDLKSDFVVDSTQYDTTSILATIERRYGLEPLTSRDAAVNDLSNVFNAKKDG